MVTAIAESEPTRIRGRSADERRNVRQDRTRPLVEALKTWMEVKLAVVSQQGKVARRSATPCRIGLD